LLFAGIPAAHAAGWLHVFVIPLLLAVTLGCGLALCWRHKVRLRELLAFNVPAAEWRRIFVIYAVAAICLLAILWLAKPSALFSLIRQRPKLWGIIMILYPPMSVIPQEVIYRAFFFVRYRPLFGGGMGMIAANAASFSFGHIVYHNWPAVALTFLGGWLFATTYRRTASLLPVAIEHSLYGCAIFTIGYGKYFTESAPRFLG
jgi:membrane protease YdiL (CAAX protease family)